MEQLCNCVDKRQNSKRLILKLNLTMTTTKKRFFQAGALSNCTRIWAKLGTRIVCFDGTADRWCYGVRTATLFTCAPHATSLEVDKYTCLVVFLEGFGYRFYLSRLLDTGTRIQKTSAVTSQCRYILMVNSLNKTIRCPHWLWFEEEICRECPTGYAQWHIIWKLEFRHR